MASLSWPEWVIHPAIIIIAVFVVVAAAAVVVVVVVIASVIIKIYWGNRKDAAGELLHSRTDKPVTDVDIIYVDTEI